MKELEKTDFAGMRKLFHNWLKDITRWGDVQNFVQYVEYRHKPFKMKVYLYTKENCYSIVALEKEGGRSYLGCTVSSRKPRAGEDWTRGNDLADGDFSQRTWDMIKNDILSYEFVKVAQTSRVRNVKENGEIQW